MKRIHFLLALMLVAGIVIGCSNDEDEEPGVYQATFSTDIYRINLSLRNEKGQHTSTFKWGKNIYFEVTVNNTTESEIRLADERFFLYNIAVTRSNGEYLGAPWIPPFMTYELRWLQIEANGQRHWLHPWIDKNYTTPIPLPKGTYYATAKGRILKSHKSANGQSYSGHDDIEIRIPFTVE